MATTEPPNKKPKYAGIKSLKDIQRILECPVCLTTPKNPDKIHLCSNEHIICDDCHSRVKTCPLCRSDFVNTRNTLLKQILSVLPKFCPNEEKGCDFETRDNEIEGHVKSCKFRPIDCIYKSCNEKIPFNSLLEHLQNIHNVDNEEYVDANDDDSDEGIEYAIRVDEKIFNEDDESLWPPTIFKFKDQTFIFCVYKAKDLFCVQCYIYNTMEEEKNYCCKIKVKDDNNSRYKMSFTGDVISVDVPKAIQRKHFGTYIFSTTMAEAVWDGQDLSFQLKLEKV